MVSFTPVAPDLGADRHELWRGDQMVAAIVQLQNGRRLVLAWDGYRVARVPRHFVTTAGARRWLRRQMGGVWFVRPHETLEAGSMRDLSRVAGG